MNWVTYFISLFNNVSWITWNIQYQRDTCELLHIDPISCIANFLECILKNYRKGKYNRILKCLVSLSIALYFREIKDWRWKYVTQSSQNQVAVKSQHVHWNVLSTLCWSNGHVLHFKKLVMVVVYYYCDQQHLVGIQSNCCLLH